MNTRMNEPMDAPLADAPLPAGLTVEEAIVRWWECHRPAEAPRWPEPLYAAGERHGVMPRPPRRRREFA